MKTVLVCALIVFVIPPLLIAVFSLRVFDDPPDRKGPWRE